MWYLWLQIVFLLALAALCGAGLAYWWLKGRYEDVTESYSTLLSKTPSAPDLMGRSDLENRLAQLAAKIDQIERTDLSPLQSQISGLVEGFPDTQTELSPILSEIHALGGELKSSDLSLQSLDDRLAAIGERMERLETGVNGTLKTSFEEVQQSLNSAETVDLGPIVQQVAELQKQMGALTQQTSTIGETYASPIKTDIARLEQNFIALKESILHPIQQDLQSLGTKVAAPSDVSKLLDGRLSAIEEHMARTQNMVRPISDKVDEIAQTTTANSANYRTVATLNQKLSEFEGSIVAIKQRMDQVGGLLSAIDQRQDNITTDSKLDQNLAEIASLRAVVTSKSSLEPLEQSIAHLQKMVFNLRERDLTTVNDTIRSIESRVDFVGVENRLTSIEYGLAATHHMLRSKLEQNTAMPPPPQREPFRQAPEAFSFAAESSLKAPEAPLDPVNMIRTPDEDGNLLLEPGFGQADNLEQIRGIGPMLRQLLNDTGVFYYWQIAEWSQADVDRIDQKLPGYQGRITRDRWVEQARELAANSGSAQRPQPFGRDE